MMLDLAINEESKGGRSVSEDKLELRLGLPAAKEESGQRLHCQIQQAFPSPAAPLGHNPCLSSTAACKLSHDHEYRFSGSTTGRINGNPFGPDRNIVRCINICGSLPNPSSSSPSPSSGAAENGGVKVNALEFRQPYSSSQKRVAPSSVIGWPPVRSFRKKVTASCNYSNSPAVLMKPANSSNPETTPDHHHHYNNNSIELQGKRDEKKVKLTTNTLNKVDVDSLYVKINMDGIPIGRKVNLKAHANYKSLSSAVDQLFRGLLPAAGSENGSQESGSEAQNANIAEISTAGLLDGNGGEYTLVYEDSEGDRVLVGDVPWAMFLSTVKRLRVLKSSELAAATNRPPART